MLLVIGQLYLSAAVGFVNGQLHAVGDFVGIHYHAAAEITCGTAYGLCQRPVGAQEALLVGVEYGHQRDLRQIKTLAQQIHADQYVIDACTQIVEYSYTVESIHIAVYIGSLYLQLGHIVVELFGHTLCQRGHQHSLLTLDAKLYLLHQIVDLVERRSDLYYRVEQTGGADKLFYHHALALLKLIVGRGGADIHYLFRKRLELLEFQWAVVESRRQSETVFHKIHLSRHIAAIHRPDLWHRHMALVNDGEEIVREIIKQAERTHARLTAVKITAVVLDAGAVSHLAHHLHVVGDTLI